MPEKPNVNPMDTLALGQQTTYPAHYDAGLLQPVPRAINRKPIGIDDHALPFNGYDLWTCFELSWLQPSGVPAVAIAEVEVPVTSPNLIESKSFKLYLNGYNQTQFESHEVVKAQLIADLSACAGAEVSVDLYSLSDYSNHPVEQLPGVSVDDQPVQINHYDYKPELLRTISQENVSETLHSDLLKSNCLITNQPDWGSVCIRYEGPQICHQSLLRYIVSFRNHNEFHEQCVERIYVDIMRICKPAKLTVFARYTRRGGLDINPFRSNFETGLIAARTARQ